SQFVRVTNSTPFNPPGAVTLEAWFKNASTTVGSDYPFQTLVAKGDSWFLRVSGGSRKIVFGTGEGIPTSTRQGEVFPSITVNELQSVSTVADTEWHHVVGIFDGMGKYL